MFSLQLFIDAMFFNSEVKTGLLPMLTTITFSRSSTFMVELEIAPAFLCGNYSFAFSRRQFQVTGMKSKALKVGRAATGVAKKFGQLITRGGGIKILG